MHSLLIATRKGLFEIQGQGTSWTIGDPHFAGDPVSQVLVDPRNGDWYAALRLGHFGVKLRKSGDRGASWTEIASPAFPAKPESGPMADDPTPWNVDMIWSLAAGGPDEPGVLWAGCMPAGLFKSEDGGLSWALNRPLWDDPRRLGWMGGGNDFPGLHSLLVDPRNSRHLTLAISCGGVWQTLDGGATWSSTAAGMKAEYMPPELVDDPNTQDPHRLVQCTAEPDSLWVQHHGGIYRSTNGGQQWLSVPSPEPSGFGFAVACDPANPSRAWFVPAQADTHRFAVNGKMVVTRTDDGGQSFQAFGAGLPARHAYHLVYRHGLGVSADGRSLAMASTTGGLWVSGDAGEHWQEVSNDLPPVAALEWVPEGQH